MMQPLRYSINVTLDGCCHHTAMAPNKEMHVQGAEQIERADALILGRVTYAMMEEAWRPVAETGVKPAWMEDWKLPLALAELGLIDVYEIVVHPTFAGHGPYLFEGLARRVDFELVDKREFASGAVALRYEDRRAR